MTTRSDGAASTPHDDGAPLEPWMLALAKEAVDDLDADLEVPRAMMWGRIERERKTIAAIPSVTRSSPRWRQITAVAAVLVGGVAIGRYLVPATPGAIGAGDTTGISMATTNAGRSANDPSRVAMQEHLVHTVALLATVSNGGAAPTLTQGSAASDIGTKARDLLTTTRLLLDQPQLRDSTTRRLLQDLELVLVQVVQARGSAPETQRAPQETLKETDLLMRMRALVTASSRYDGSTYGGN